MAAKIILNTGKLVKTINPDSFGEEPSSLRLAPRSEWQTIHYNLSLILSLFLLLP